MAKILPKPHLPQTATLATVVDGLAEPEEYVRRIFSQMGKRREDIQVRVSIASDTEAPDYIFDECMGEPADPDDRGHPVPMAAFSGRTHRPLSCAKTDRPLNWSTSAMSWQQVQDLLGRLRHGNSRIATALATSK